MGSFDDLDEPLLDSVLKWLNSTELRNSACLVCKRWRTACTSRPALWRDLDINIAWEIHNPRGLGSHLPAPLSRALHRGRGSGGGPGGSGGRGRNPHGRRGVGGRHAGRPAFLSASALYRWLQLRSPRAEVLRVSHAELRVTVLGLQSDPGDRSDLQPSDLTGLLASLPHLTELHLDGACNLLPDPSALLHVNNDINDINNQQLPPPPTIITPRHTAPAAGGPLPLLPPALPLAAAPPVPPLAERLTRLALRRAGYDFQSDEGAAQAAALGGLRGLRELSLTMEPVSELGLARLPRSWSELTGLTALELCGHQRLRRLPSWLSGSLSRLREVRLESCGLRRLPVGPLGGLTALRRLSLDRCPLGSGSPAVSLDGWWPPDAGRAGEGEGEREGGAKAGEEAGEGEREGGAKAGEGVGRPGGGVGGVGGLEVLQLRDCDILALPYTMTRLTNLRRLELGGNPLGDLALPPLDNTSRGSGRMRDCVLRYLVESGDRGFRELGSLPLLSHLGLEGCGLGGVPLGVEELTQLTSLDLSHNPQLELAQGGVAELPLRLPRLTRLRLAATSAAEQLRQPGPGLPGCDPQGGRELQLLLD